jgi:hypothetical protein
MPIHTFLQPGVFEPEVIAVMTEAFEAARKEFHDPNHPPTLLEIIAERIIDTAGKGELDPDRLREAALAGLAGRPR